MSARIHCDAYPCKNVKPTQNAVWIHQDQSFFDTADEPIAVAQAETHMDFCSWNCLARWAAGQLDSSPACIVWSHQKCTSPVCTCSCHVNYLCLQAHHDECKGTVDFTEDGDKGSGELCRDDCHRLAGGAS